MKQILLTLIFLFGISQAHAQEFTEFSVTGTKWYARHHYSDPLPAQGASYVKHVYLYRLGTDTVIGEEAWKRLHKEIAIGDSDGKSITDLGFIREAEGKVWFYPEDLGEDYLYDKEMPVMLYDFTLQKGDTIYRSDSHIGYTYKPASGNNTTMKVKDAYVENGRKVIDFGNEKWIEGVGSNTSAFFDRWLLRADNGSSSWEEPLQVITDGGVLVYFQGEILPDGAEDSWLKEGMSWHEYKAYGENQEGFIREVSLAQGEFQGRFKVKMADTPFVYLQECNKKVYGMMSDQTLVLCYDFSLKKGEGIKLPRHFYAFNSPSPKYDNCTVSKVDSIEMNGKLRKRITLTGDREDVWVEGIGSLNRIFPIDEYNVESTMYPVSHVICCSDGESLLYLHPDYMNCTTKRPADIPYTETKRLTIQALGSTVSCLSPTATLLEVYTLDAVKVGQASFHNGEAVVTVSKTPATYLYIVTYPDGRRESGKALVSE